MNAVLFPGLVRRDPGRPPGGPPPLPGPAARGRASLLGAPAGPGLGLCSRAAGCLQVRWIGPPLRPRRVEDPT